MSSSPPVIPVRLSRWPFLALLVVTIVGLWVLDTHQPPPWPESATAWFSHLRGTAPASVLLDRANAATLLTPDLPGGSALVLLVIGCCALATALAVQVPPPLALAVAVGLMGTRSAWSTATPGDDALPMMLVSLAVLAVAWPAGRAASATAAALGITIATPVSLWLAAPAVTGLGVSRRRRALIMLALSCTALAVQVLLVRHAWGAVGCLDAASWTAALGAVLRPGVSADVSAWTALRQAAAVHTGDVHLFGVAVAVFGLIAGRGGALRRATLVAVLVASIAVATGLVPPALGAALLLPWWTPWFALGLAGLVSRTNDRHRHAALVFVVIVAALTPVMRHATVVPGPWVAGTPAIARAVADATPAVVFASKDPVFTRRMRDAGGKTVPADRAAIRACMAAGRGVSATGDLVTTIEEMGFITTERPLRAPVADVLRDIRSDQLIAMALAPASLPWAGARGVAALGRLDVRRENVPATAALGVVARADRGGRVESSRDGLEFSLQTGDVVGGRQLLVPVSVRARLDDAEVDSPPIRLATSTRAALVVFDRAHDVVLRTAADASPGLPVSLATHVQWRHAVVTGQPACVRLDDTWGVLPGTAPQVSVSIVGASPRTPMVAWLASDQRPQVSVTGRGLHPVSPEWQVETFDRHQASGGEHARARWQADEVPELGLGQHRWVVRVEVRPRAAWHHERVAITAGTTPAVWLVRLAGGGSRESSRSVCAMAASGERLLHGQYGVVDDDSVREIAVRASEGWHTPERSSGHVQQWSARTTASATFRLSAPQPLVLAMDASAAAVPSGPQRLTVRVNGYTISEDWPGAARVSIPVHAVHAGDNVLTLTVPQVLTPPRDPRTLGVLVRQLRVIRAPER